MAVHYRTQGLIIKKSDRGEADQFLTIYTKDFGKLKILGKAVRKIKSKLRGGADLFYLSEIEFIQGKIHKTLTDAVLIDGFFNIRRDLTRLSVAYQIVDLLDDLAPGEQKDEPVWQLVNEVFQRLNNQPFVIRHLPLLYHYFFWNLVSLFGYQPELRADSLCGKKINTDLAKILKIIIKRDWRILSRLKIDDDHIELLKNISRWYKINI
jgi:DNA repair protein RecO (recombination protein O)